MRPNRFATNTVGTHADRRRASAPPAGGPAEDRIRATSVRNHPLHDDRPNQTWLENAQTAPSCSPGCRYPHRPAVPGSGRPAVCRCDGSPPPLTWSPPHPPTRQALALVRTDHRRPGPAPEPLEPPIDKYLSSPTSSTAPTEPPDTENPYKLSVQRGFRESGGPSEPSLPRPRHSNKGLHRTLTLWQHDKSQRMQDRPVLKCVALLLTRRMTDSELSEQTGISSRVRTALRGVPSINGG